jgi:universal stress protein E
LVGCGFEEFLHDSYTNFSEDAAIHRKWFCEKMKKRLQVFADALQAQGVKTDCRVHWTFPRYEQIAAEAKELDVDLVIQHVNLRKPYERQNLSHDTWELIKTCHKPLLLIKDNGWTAAPVIMAAVDPVNSHHKPEGLDFTILNTALEIEKALAGVLHVVHAYSESARPFAKAGSILASHSAAMEDLLAGYAFSPSAIHLLDETPVNAILQSQESLQAEVIVIGALSRSRLAEAIIGNTADRLLDFVHSDLYIIRST